MQEAANLPCPLSGLFCARRMTIMKVSELKKYLELVDDETEVMIEIVGEDQMNGGKFHQVIFAESVELNNELCVIHGVDKWVIIKNMPLSFNKL